MAKKKNKIPKPRNPMAQELGRNGLFRTRREKSTREKEEHKNSFSRSAKHKKIDLAENYDYTDYLDVDHDRGVIYSAETGEELCYFRLEKRVSRNHLSEPTGRIILDIDGADHIVSSWDEATDYLMRMMQSSALVTEAQIEVDVPIAVATVFEDFQLGDKVKITSGPLKAVLDKAEKLRKKSDDEKSKEAHDEGVVTKPNGPANTIGITVNGQYHIVNEEDLELIFESIEDIRENEDFSDLLEFRFTEIQSGVRIPISSEEQVILDKCKEKMYKSSLDERDQEVARRMVSRGILNRRKDDNGKLYFVPNTKKLTRF